jgi:hypothetical protein
MRFDHTSEGDGLDEARAGHPQIVAQSQSLAQCAYDQARGNAGRLHGNVKHENVGANSP